MWVEGGALGSEKIMIEKKKGVGAVELGLGL